MIVQGLLLGVVGLVAYGVRGAVGGAGNMVANAVILCLVALQMSAGLTLRDGIYWAALAGASSGLMTSWYILRTWRPDKVVYLVLLGALPANAVFTIILTRIDTQHLMVAMSCVTIATGLYLMRRNRRADLSLRTVHRLAVPAGVLSGALAGLFGMGGPPMFLLLSRASEDPTLFRARISTISMTTNLLRVVVLVSVGAFTTNTVGIVAVSVPFILIGTGLGLWVHQFIRPRVFRMILGVLVMLGGVVGLASTVG